VGEFEKMVTNQRQDIRKLQNEVSQGEKDNTKATIEEHQRKKGNWKTNRSTQRRGLGQPKDENKTGSANGGSWEAKGDHPSDRFPTRFPWK
jgi:hypothetical protein